MQTTSTARRPLKTRQREWAKAIARFLVRQRVHPNVISVMSIVFAALAGVAFSSSSYSTAPHRVVLLLVAAAGIQLRLLCNMLDGMVAVEGGMQTKSGEIFNDLPDRISDAMILVPVGYAVPGLPYGPALGWCAALLAIFTAYVRLLGGTAGLTQSFIGPMAKPHRMATLTAACLLSVAELKFLHTGTLLWIALVVINVGCVITIGRRTALIMRGLEAR
ncbi:MAG TPA: CDP-alcohol phosphatidyltransferase family protein [Candidatus Dormibacteraeota bacterium]|jgi:phosphatidylglycerophosphate synthase|nr:CDP-alcohol phosphatidyltransferase family protein [Candidatus Dormibacteraeota bacterium]